jgi:calcium/proton exchanger cax
MAMYTNDTVGGLLNASFGNATEVIIACFALRKGYLRIVQLTLLGSIVSNLLLVMGSAFVAGGLVSSSQKFNQQVRRGAAQPGALPPPRPRPLLQHVPACRARPR